VTDLLVCDLDLDQDPDILCTYHKGNYLAWFQNNGTGEFGEMKIISNEQITPESVFASDLDNDGDPDILCASASDNKVLWYENDTDYSISDPNLDSRLYPNPSNGIVYLTGAEKGIARVFSSNGVLIYQISCSGKTKIDLSSQTQGIYIISFTGKSGLRLNRKVAIITSH
jgi:hypothetical protein